jgi:dihydroorotate dehydrogenase electron transfer subunit
MRTSLPVVLRVEEVVEENALTATIYFRRPDPEQAAAGGLDLDRFVPGQFFMVWLLRVDEKPYAISHLDAERLALTVQRRGPCSEMLCELKPGAPVGLRGPFGRGFWGFDAYEQSSRVALIGGGCGMAVVAPLTERLPGAAIVQGARTADMLLFRRRWPQQVIFTDDGSAGRRGLPTDWLAEEAAAGRIEMVYTCGPEAMMHAVAQACRGAGIGCQACLERYMKCGLGVCGQCDCDGRRVCLEGPVFDLDELASMPSFGTERRDKTGRRIDVGSIDGCPAGPRGQPRP